MDSAGSVAPLVTVTINSNGWFHLAVTKQGQTIKYYLNGAIVRSREASSNQPGIRSNGNLPLVIGVSNLGYMSPASGLQWFFNGSMDDMMIYNRTLGAAEVVMLYSTSIPIQPSGQPSCQPSNQPSAQPSTHPSSQPSNEPSAQPSSHPSSQPSNEPSAQPSSHPSNEPSNQPSAQPSSHPASQPSNQPSAQPTSCPSAQPTNQPSTPPFNHHSAQPTTYSSNHPTTKPSANLTGHPSNQPSHEPSITQRSAPPSTKPASRSSNPPSSLPSTPPVPSVMPSIGLTARSSIIYTAPPTVSLTNEPSLTPSLLPTATASLVPSFLSSTASSSLNFFYSCSNNDSSWKDSLFLFGLYSNDDESFKTLNISSASNSPSFIIFGSELLTMSSSSLIQIDVSCAPFSCHYPVTSVSTSYKRDITSRAAVIPGDVNGDTYNDLLVCSPLISSCYIFFGEKEDGLKNVLIGVTISGPSGVFFGFAVAGIEDINGDGFIDIMVSALTGKTCYVIYGRRSWSSEMKVSEMVSGMDGYKIMADSSTTLTGVSVAGVGDMNGDGISDVAFSVVREGVFLVYVVWEGGNDVSLSEVGNGIKGLRAIGEQGYYTGLSIAGVGDVNKDGLADLVIGAIPYPDKANSLKQKTYVILGSSYH